MTTMCQPLSYEYENLKNQINSWLKFNKNIRKKYTLSLCLTLGGNGRRKHVHFSVSIKYQRLKRIHAVQFYILSLGGADTKHQVVWEQLEKGGGQSLACFSFTHLATVS